MRFHVTKHAELPDREIVEIRSDEGELLGVVYPIATPGHGDGVRVMSKYLLDVVREGGEPPAAWCFFGPRG